VCDDTVQGVSLALRNWMTMSTEDKVSLKKKQLEVFERLFSVDRTAERLDSVLTEVVARHQSIEKRIR